MRKTHQVAAIFCQLYRHSVGSDSEQRNDEQDSVRPVCAGSPQYLRRESDDQLPDRKAVRTAA